MELTVSLTLKTPLKHLYHITKTLIHKQHLKHDVQLSIPARRVLPICPFFGQ